MINDYLLIDYTFIKEKFFIQSHFSYMYPFSFSIKVSLISVYFSPSFPVCVSTYNYPYPLELSYSLITNYFSPSFTRPLYKLFQLRMSLCMLKKVHSPFYDSVLPLK